MEIFRHLIFFVCIAARGDLYAFLPTILHTPSTIKGRLVGRVSMTREFSVFLKERRKIQEEASIKRVRRGEEEEDLDIFFLKKKA